jgi:hypothetical protein
MSQDMTNNLDCSNCESTISKPRKRVVHVRDICKKMVSEGLNQDAIEQKIYDMYKEIGRPDDYCKYRAHFIWCDVVKPRKNKVNKEATTNNIQ